MRQIELLIPARDGETGRAAVDHGADAVYIGGPAFGARVAAGNSIETIADLVEYGHRYRVKVYAALNTLLYEEELTRAEQMARELLAAGVDALIIQDPAYLMMGLEGAVFHASTQMCNTGADRVGFFGRSGFSRVVLERGLTLEEICDISARCGVETECFVHGAICVGHSGRCYLSRSMGPRSGNRGECSQPCRLAYDLEDGQGNVLLRGKHLLSVRDLNLSAYIGRMIDAGVTSFKVEGRLKETEYVKNVTAYYRNLLDAEIARRPGVRKSSDGDVRYGFTPDPAKTFSRGFTTWNAGGMRPGVASFDTPKALGEPIGRVAGVGDGYFTLDRRDAGGSSRVAGEVAQIVGPADSGGILSAGGEVSGRKTIVAGDGLCFLAGGRLTGTNVNKVDGNRVYPNRTDGIMPGAEVFRNRDHRFLQMVQRSAASRTVAVRVECRADGAGLSVTAADGCGNRAVESLAARNGPAGNRERMAAVIESQIRKTGGTIYRIKGLTLVTGDNGEIPFLAAGELNALRRRLLDELTARRLEAFGKERQAAVISAAAARDDKYPYMDSHLGGEDNITNSLSRRFWENHGVTGFEPANDLRRSLDGLTVMTTPYCLRREIGVCLKDNPDDKIRELYLHRVNFRYRLDFDCVGCRMRVVKVE